MLALTAGEVKFVDLVAATDVVLESGKSLTDETSESDVGLGSASFLLHPVTTKNENASNAKKGAQEVCVVRCDI